MTEGPGTARQGVVIIGGGLGGAKTAEALREQGYDGAITIVGAEDKLPYERPALSKEYQLGQKQLADFTVHPARWYDEHHVGLRLSTSATAVDVTAHTVTLDDGSRLGYDKLVLATGSRSRHLDLPGADAAGVFYLRTYDEAVALSQAIGSGTRVAIIGSGWIGLEIASSARQRGAEVTVIGRDAQPLLGALGPELGAVFAELHRSHGVDLVLGVQVTGITTAAGHATGVSLADGRVVDADVVLIGAGAITNIGLAEAAGIATEHGGVLVDAGLRTSAPDVFAVGDIAAWQHPLFETRIQGGHWANALNHGTVAAANILGGHEAYDLLPYFYTDQFDLGMEYSGHPAGSTRVVFRGDVSVREFIAFWLDANDAVLAGMNVNVWDVTDDIQALVRSRRPVDVARLTDPTVPLRELLG